MPAARRPGNCRGALRACQHICHRGMTALAAAQALSASAGARYVPRRGCAPALVSAQSPSRRAQQDAQPMNAQPGYGRPNPNAPPELSQFGFRIGNRRREVRVKGTDGTWERTRRGGLAATDWTVNVITDEYRMANAAGELMVAGST